MLKGAKTFAVATAAVALISLAASNGQSALAHARASEEADIARGAYLVERVALCGRCHTPIDESGSRDHSRRLMGGPLDVTPTRTRDTWAIVAPRLAGAPPGSDEEFVRLLMTGVARNGKKPRPPMPQFLMTREDAEAVLAYVKTLRTDRH